MKNLECVGKACLPYCQALGVMGVAVENPGTDCNVPATMINVTETGITFRPNGDLTNSELVGAIGQQLCYLLYESAKNANPEAVAGLVERHSQVFDARMGLWQSMLGSLRQERTFTAAELDFYSKQVARAENELNVAIAKTESADTILLAQAVFDRQTVETCGLLFDTSMIRTVNRLVGNLMDTKPTLLVGDKGIAKTKVAEFVAGLWLPDQNPIMISGHGNMMTSELVGKVDIRDGNTVYRQGKFVDAMHEGRPIILDEVNIPDPAVMGRFHHFLLTKPGDTVTIQENGNERIKVQPGFVVFATANEASARYLRRNVLDPAFRDRYDVVHLTYPDSDNQTPLATVPSSLMRLAMASAVDEHGVLSQHVNLADLETFVRIAHVTQHLYSVPAKKARVAIGGSVTNSLLDDEPALTDCITPRTLADVVRRCASGNKPGITIAAEMERAISSLDQAGSTRNQDMTRRALKLIRSSS